MGSYCKQVIKNYGMCMIGGNSLVDRIGGTRSNETRLSILK